MMDLAVLTAICDTNRVIFMKMPASRQLQVPGHQRRRARPFASHWQCRHGRRVHRERDRHDSHDRQVVRAAVRLPRRQARQRHGRRPQAARQHRDRLVQRACRTATPTTSTTCRSSRPGAAGTTFKVGQAVNVEGGKADMTPGHSDEDCVDGQTPFAQLDSLGDAARRRHAADQQVLLQPDERDRRQGRRGRPPVEGRHASPSPGTASTTTPGCSAPRRPPRRSRARASTPTFAPASAPAWA